MQNEKVTNKKAIYKQTEEQLGDIPHTYANIDKAKKDLNYIYLIQITLLLHDFSNRNFFILNQLDKVSSIFQI